MELGNGIIMGSLAEALKKYPELVDINVKSFSKWSWVVKFKFVTYFLLKKSVFNEIIFPLV